MYANLRVTDKQTDEVYSAWQVTTHADGTTTVYLDDPNGPDEKYANPAGEKHFRRASQLEIAADW